MQRQAVLVLALLAILAATLSLNSPPAALAQETSPISLEVEAGFDEKARVGNWIPVVVRLENQGPDLSAEIHVIGNRGHPMSSGSYVADVVLPRDGRKRLTLHVPYMTATPRLDVELVADGEVVASLEPPVNIIGETDLFVGVVGRRAGARSGEGGGTAPGCAERVRKGKGAFPSLRPGSTTTWNWPPTAPVG